MEIELKLLLAAVAVWVALVYVVVQEVVLRRVNRRHDDLYDAVVCLARGTHEVKVDKDGDIHIRKRKGT